MVYIHKCLWVEFIMNTFSFHLLWILFLFILTIMFVVLRIHVIISARVIVLRIPVYNSLQISIRLLLRLDIFSSLFSSTVLLIRSVVIAYSYFYIRPYSKSKYFLTLTLLFIVRILVVINFVDIFFVMLGWDGLGLVSFLLIAYYQNSSSIRSALFTVYINRLGDCLLILSICLYATTYNINTFNSLYVYSLDVGLLLVALITKRAIYPFSPWLPLAMAAPTPISALVHSSTLVTAGLYLIFRFSSFIYSSKELIQLLLLVRIFTSLYAGINSIVEVDIKKIIALSTLSHLGFIAMAFSCGMLNLAFFHLLTHALFKSLLFMAMGDVIINMFHYQDIRVLSFGASATPFSSFIIIVSILSLLGVPRVRGFFSKDIILETMEYRSISSAVILIVVINLLLTYCYTYKLMYFVFRRVKTSPLSIIHAPRVVHSFLLLLLSVLRVVFGTCFLWFLDFSVLHVATPTTIKMSPPIIHFFTFICLFIFLQVFVFLSPKIVVYFSGIIFLYELIITVTSFASLRGVFNTSKRAEFGAYGVIINGFIPQLISTLSRLIYSQTFFSSLFYIFLSLLFCLFLIII